METNTTRKKNTKYEPVKLPDFGKMPPQAIDLEESVLGALMIEPDAFSVVSEILRPESFYKDNHQIIYNAIRKLGVEQHPIDLLTVQEQLNKDGVLEQVGGAYSIASLTSNVVSAVHLEFHAKIIAQKHLARELIRISTEIQNDAFEPETDVDELMQQAEGKIFELSQINHKKDVVSIKDILPESIKRIEEASRQESNLTGVASKFFALDKITSGWQRSDLIIFAARPAMGKTAFVLTMAKNVAANGDPVAFFSLEMSNVQLVNRLIVNASELPGDLIKSGKLTTEQFKSLNEGIGKLENLPLWIDDTPSLSILELRTKARRLHREHGIKLIIIDYLQLMNASGMQFSNREGEVSKISRGLKGLAKELDIPIIALSQLNRNLETRGGGKDDNKNEAKKPQLSDLRESGAIEQDADIVCFIHRPEYYKITEDANGQDLRGIGQIIIAKHRNGATADINLYFAQDFAMFLNDRTEWERLRGKAANTPKYETFKPKKNKPTKTDFSIPEHLKTDYTDEEIRIVQSDNVEF
ncbi:MAG: replicative DNA helicase [Prevotellaceae bacterium]|jgi:replicative DNA helicase|nr:replicative DNA helicase [Prevotellaceae bacterium]